MFCLLSAWMKKKGFSVYWVISSFACFSGWTMISMKVTDDCGCILQERQGGIQGAAEAATGRQLGLPPHQSPAPHPPWARHPCNIHPQPTGRIHPKGAYRSSSPLNLIHNRTALSQHVQTDPCLSNSAVTIKIWSEGGLLTNPPTHSKSKCAIKNAHLTSSSRLPNAYASYLRDQEKWYCKRYRISFITYTIQISSGGGWWFFFFPPVLPSRLNLGKVWNRYRTCWKTPIWMLLRLPSTYSDWLSH